jgi:hypothetical protein
MQPVRENLLLRNNKFILKRGLQALRPQFDPDHPRRARGICHCAKINYPKPILGKTWPNIVTLSFRNDKVRRSS